MSNKIITLSGAANEVLYALFFRGALLSGDLPSKSGAAELRELGFAETRHTATEYQKENHFTFLTSEGQKFAVEHLVNTRFGEQQYCASVTLGVEIDTFDIIYELSEWLETALKNRTPKKEEQHVTGKAKILKYFSTQKHTHVLGGRVDEGELKAGQQVRIIRRDVIVGKGTLKNVQQAKQDTDRVTEGEFGMQLESRDTIAAGDYIEAFDTVIT